MPTVTGSFSASFSTSFSTAAAFVAGATGYTGRAVVAALRARGVETVAHVRPDSSNAAEWRRRFEALGAKVDQSPWDQAAMRSALTEHRPTHVFALLGTTRRRAAREGLASPYETVDYGLTKLLLDAASACGHGPRFVYLSSLGAREDTSNPYLLVRGRLERELQASRLPFLIVRPAFITGSDREESRPTERIASMVFDATLKGLAAVGLRGPQKKLGSLTGTQLAEGITALALSARDARSTADVAAIRGAIPAELA
jgi:nucleoside-diphosphate-sugar epimerase